MLFNEPYSARILKNFKIKVITVVKTAFFRNPDDPAVTHSLTKGEDNPKISNRVLSEFMYFTSLAYLQLANSTIPLPNQLLTEVSDSERAHLNVPLLPQGVDHAALDGAAAGPADGDAHLVVAGQAVQLPLQLPRLCSQLLPGNTNGPTSKNTEGNASMPRRKFWKTKLES